MYSHPMSLDRKLYQDIEVRPEAVETPDLFGVEVELEGRKIKTQKPGVLTYWDMHNDGSLRINFPGAEAVEYVLKTPSTLDTTHDAIKALYGHLNSDGVEVFESYRTSIHVHVNCAADTLRTILNFITLSIIFDELFVSQNGDHRIGNNFCLRAKDAQGQIDELVRSITHHGNIWGLNAQHRYSSVNFVSLLKYGTVEFRSLECTTDRIRVQNWVNTLARLKVSARSFDNPQDIIRYFSRMSPIEFLYYVLGGHASRYVNIVGFDVMLQHGMRLAQDLAYSASWENRKEGEVEPKKKRGGMKMAEPLPMNFAQMVQAQIAEHQAQMQAQPAQAPAPHPAQINQWVNFLQPPPEPGDVVQVQEW